MIIFCFIYKIYDHNKTYPNHYKIPQMNCKKDMLLDAPCPELLCGLCSDILDDPMQVHCSEDHMFCRSCLANYQKASCPSCMEPLDKTSFQLSKFVKRQISRLRVSVITKLYLVPIHNSGAQKSSNKWIWNNTKHDASTK
ncbi:hypothetical protein BC941DRAFT_449975 [Chlamydoabsidia padenii]|nr:hypothetical protein BC941DRAFT_449975 [Chlamydoabsidia padenii]